MPAKNCFVVMKERKKRRNRFVATGRQNIILAVFLYLELWDGQDWAFLMYSGDNAANIWLSWMECSSIMVSYKKLKKTREREKRKRKNGCVCTPSTDGERKYRTGKCLPEKQSGITGGKLQLFLRSTKSGMAFTIWRRFYEKTIEKNISVF